MNAAVEATKSQRHIDWFAEIDRRIPPWHAQVTQQDTHGHHSGMTPAPGGDNAKGKPPEDLVTGVREVVVTHLLDPLSDDDEEVSYVVTMPYQPYLRVVSPQGELKTLLTGQTRDKEEDQLWYEERQKAAKRRMGWLIAERGESHAGMTGSAYGRFLFEEMRRRRAKHTAKMDELARTFETQHQKRMEAAAEHTLDAVRAQGDVLVEIARGMRDASSPTAQREADELRAQLAAVLESNRQLSERMAALEGKRK